MIFKILRGLKQSAPNATSRNGWIFWCSKCRLRYPSIYMYRFSIYRCLISSKRLIDKYLYYPNHSTGCLKKIRESGAHKTSFLDIFTWCERCWYIFIYGLSLIAEDLHSEAEKTYYTCIVWSHEKKDSRFILFYCYSISKCYNFYVLLCSECH